jgi:paraquat-inducible protein B
MPNATGEEFADFLRRGGQGGMRVRKAKAGIAGPSFLTIEFLDPEEHPAPPLDWEPRHPYIPWARSEGRELIDSVLAISQELEEADLGEVFALVDELRATNRRLAEILDDPRLASTFDTLTATLSDVHSLFDDSKDDLRTVIGDLPELTARLGVTMDRVDELLNDPRLQSILDNMDSLSGDAAPLVTDARRTLQRVDRLIAGQEQVIVDILATLNRTLDDLALLIGDARQNPSRMIFGDPPPKQDPGGKR